MRMPWSKRPETPEPAAGATVTAEDEAYLREQAWARRLGQLAGATARPRDDERLETAFAQLTAAGIVSTMNLGFDQGEGSDLGRSLAAEAPGSRGFAFFHGQDAEVRAALAANGLAVTWDGTPLSRIQVTGLDWRRPLPVD